MRGRTARRSSTGNIPGCRSDASARFSRLPVPASTGSARGQARKSRCDAQDRRAVPQPSLPGGAADRPDARAGRLQGEPQAGQTADAGHGAGGTGAEAPNQQAWETQDFPVSAEGMKIDRPNEVWAADITYIPIGRGFLYLVAIMDWASRAVLAFRLSNTMDTAFCLEALDEALRAMVRQRFSTPIRAASSPRRLSPTGSPLRTSAFRWTAAGAISTTSSSNGCGAR